MNSAICRWLAVLAITGVATSARAGDFCVDTVAELVSAVTAFNNQADGTVLTIKVVQGNYVVNGQLGATLSTFPRSVGLKVLGGYTAGCASRSLNPANTIIDGNNQANSALHVVIHSDANAYIEGLTFTRMASTQQAGALSIGSDVDTSDVAYFAIRHCRFTRNSGPSIVDLEGPQMRFINNLVADNTVTGGGSAVQIRYAYNADSGAGIDNNTIANNVGGGLNVASHSDYASPRLGEITNNVLWGNSGADLRLLEFNSVSNFLFVNANVYGNLSGTLPGGSSLNLSSNPQFVNGGAGNYGLAVSSPAINSGAGYQYYGLPDKDLAGTDRVVGSQIDRGALESGVDDNTTAFVTNVADNGSNTAPLAGSLRAAIKAANGAGGPYKIKFSISGSCPRIINMTTPMLDITGKVTIDARTQSGWSANTDYGRFDANLCIVVNGSGSTPYAFHVPSSAASARLVVHGMMFAGFTDAAIKIENGSDHRIAGNQFGAVPFTSANGAAVRITGASGGAVIGGFDDPSAVNLIAGSSVAGIYLDNASGGNTLGNNVIGFQPDGTSLGSNTIGVYIFNSPNNTLLYNYIGHSTSNGVSISGASSSNTTVQYNRVGVDRLDNMAGNQGAGIGLIFAAHDSTIGAPLLSSFGGNLISYNVGPGVWISPSGGSGNRVLANQYFENGNVDIDLGSAGPTANQASNPASGPNHLQNYPILSSAQRSSGANATVLVNGSLHSAPSSAYRIDVYFASGCDASAPGRGSAYAYLGRGNFQTDASGNANFTLTVPAVNANFGLGGISAVATSASGDSSEVGNCVQETPLDQPNQVFKNGFE